MSDNKIEVPTFEDAKNRFFHHKATPLDKFIYHQAPVEPMDVAMFLDDLEKALRYVIENADTFGLTLDGADSPIPAACPLCGRDPEHHDMYCDNHPHNAKTPLP